MTITLSQASEQDIELLQAYLDRRLSPEEESRVQQRLDQESEIAAAYYALVREEDLLREVTAECVRDEADSAVGVVACAVPSRPNSLALVCACYAVAGSVLVLAAAIFLGRQPGAGEANRGIEIVQTKPDSPTIPLGRLPKAEELVPFFPADFRRAGLVIGVNQCEHRELPTLTSAEDEAIRIRDDWIRRSFGAHDNHVVSLIGNQATEVSIRAALSWLKQFSKPTDTVVLYVVSHGRVSANDQLLVMARDSDATSGLPLQELLERLGPTQAQVLVVLDVCYSGKLVPPSVKLPNLWMVASAQSDQPAWEHTGGATYFGDAWRQAVTGNGDADGIVTLEEAFEATHRYMILHSAPQKPELAPADDRSSRLAVSLAPVVWDLVVHQPGKTLPSPRRVSLRLLEDPNPSDIYTLTLNGDPLGRLWKLSTSLPVEPGTHRLTVSRFSQETLRLAEGSYRLLVARRLPAWAKTDGELSPDAEWSAEVVVGSDDPPEQDVLLAPRVTVSQVNVLPASGVTPFSRVNRRASDPAAVQHEFTEGVHRIEFTPRSSRPELLGLEFHVEKASGINVGRQLELRPNQRPVLSFECRGRTGNEPVRFVCGGAGDSLSPPVTLDVVLSNTWKRYEIPLPADATKLQDVVVGFGVQFNPLSAPGQSVTLLVRDAVFRLEPAQSP